MPRIANRILAATEPATEERRDALVAAAREIVRGVFKTGRR